MAQRIQYKYFLSYRSNHYTYKEVVGTLPHFARLKQSTYIPQSKNKILLNSTLSGSIDIKNIETAIGKYSESNTHSTTPN